MTRQKPSYYTAPVLYVGDVGAVTSPDVIGSVLSNVIGNAEQEYFVAVALDKRMRVLECGVMSIGSDSLSIVDPKGIMRWALTRAKPTHGLLFAHNHPSGNTEPSRQDRDVTAKLGVACKTVGLELVDHLIVGASCSHARDTLIALS